MERVRATHTFRQNTQIESAEYGEVKKEGFTQIYANGALGCVVTWRNGNDEVILWPDYHTENWYDGKFQSMQYASVEYRYNSPKGRETWQSMWERDNEWYKHATEFYLEDNQTSMSKSDVWHAGRWDGTAHAPAAEDGAWREGVRMERIPHTADVSTLLRQMRQLCV